MLKGYIGKPSLLYTNVIGQRHQPDETAETFVPVPLVGEISRDVSLDSVAVAFTHVPDPS